MQTQTKCAAGTQGDVTIVTAEPLNLTKRIGSTTYLVSVHSSKTSKETAEDKVLRLMKREVDKIA